MSTSITEQVKSLRQTVGKDFIKPDEDKISTFSDNLKDNPEVLDYLYRERSLTDETIEHFKLGYDPVQNAISIPIYKDGELVNIKYRLLNPDKYKYISEKGAENWLYNEDGIEAGESKGGILVVEGEFDLMACWQAGIKNVVSPALGKDSYGVWLERLDNIKRIYIAYDNDEAGRTASRQFAERLGIEKCYEVRYPEDYKDANEFLSENGIEDFRELFKNATPYYSYQFKNLGDVINDLRNNDEQELELDCIPCVKIEKDWLMVISGVSNVGKTTYCMNIARELSEKGVPSLVMPFERGTASVGKRFLQVLFDKTSEDFRFASEDEWETMIDKAIETPVYFSTPRREDIRDIVVKSKRLFDTRVVIIDHLDYIVRHTENQSTAIANAMQDLKRLGEEHGIIFMVVTHLRKIEHAGAQERKKPGIEDLKGSSSLYQDPECVVLLHSEETGTINVNIAKNKGEMCERKFGLRSETGRLGEFIEDDF